MASIYKLSVSGVRSFSGDTHETIQFERPLTLIVGANGSGKTTIIEALRYATTGDLPPNSKNGAFVNDPSMTGATETKAQVKLAFQNVNRTSMVLTKSLAAFKNARTGTTSFKTRENQLVAIHNGEKQTVTSKMADIETAVPQQLGVSRAVLNYVIFCHQDESLWPISDSASLKKRFDEIFDSVKFIKVLETFRAIQKEMNVDIRVINNTVEHLRNDRARAHHKHAQVAELNRQVDRLNAESETLAREIEAVNKEADRLFATNQDYEKTISRLEYLRQQESSLAQQMDVIRSTTTRVDLPDAQIREQLDNFANVLVEKRSAVEQLRVQIESRSAQLARAREEYNTSVREEGRLRGLFERHEQNRSEKQRLEQQLDQTRLDALAAEYADKEAAHKAALEDVEFELTTLKEELAREAQHAEYVRNDVDALETKRAKFQQILSLSSSNQARLERERTELAAEELELQQLRDSSPLAAINEKIAQTEKQIRQLEVEQEDLLRKVSQASRQSDSTAKVYYLRRNLESVEQKLENAYSRLETRDVDAFMARYKQTEAAVLEKASRVQELRETLNEAAITHRNGAQQLAGSRDELAALEKDVRTVLGAAPLAQFEELLEDAEYEFSDCDGGFKVREYCIGFNKRAIDLINHKNACLLCHREFGAADEKSRVLELLAKQTSVLESDHSAEEALRAARDKLDRLKEVSGKVERHRKLAVELEQLQKDVEAARERETVAREQFESEQRDLDEQQAHKSQLASLLSAVDEVTRLRDEQVSLQRQLQGLKDDMALFGGQLQSMEELELAQAQTSSEMKRLRLVLERHVADREQYSRRLMGLESMIKDRRLAIIELEKSDLDNVNVRKSLHELETEIGQLRATLDRTEQAASVLRASHAAQQERYGELKRRGEDELAQLLPELERLRQTQAQIAALDAQIREFEQKHAGQTTFEQESARLREQIARDEVELDALGVQLRELENDLKDADNAERNLRYNLDLLALEQQQSEVRATIAELAQQQAESRRDEYVAQSKQLRARQTQLQSEYSTKLGEMTQLSRQIQSVKHELQRDYKDIDERYTKEYASLQTKLSMVTDLTTYYKAIDSAVMEFHQVKMKEINRIIDELWKKTYMGNDVDSIMVRADPIKSSTAATMRSYNYRVVMVKNGTELDMRGRCSAGQRVLAALIIRLALAECFGLNFGMIALDEPTTNLDDDNIESLAKALANIIQERATQRNFQLIVITHDEKFLRAMNAVDFTDHYYKVIRNERLNSTINKVQISQLDD
ncbi:hypothetical protein KL918_000158 [Ogataea parapolymorpha]|uniref:DNA repair protein RAD50 n=1 Tax=Ogataea parapolymorpha (strain ATCC 26012 / BCRC 20466 / JCM 22074 / NRRL Y-7560 / DL-1) TaxID=871575 RepID=W1Q790_OGAPD|nr:DNA repair protein RAD50 [Ogataea parapolymorpha DL-1]ESW96209.1 DNA repair protein RAD50 [Ogataea parapolymorpha DL-1]KAG7869954.1 hypothetical protein KL918_000158 [Ogataea parapolymorpha]KAG7873242.1 hypothetical protein KL916_002543 [Ogataea parapolymorpha]